IVNGELALCGTASNSTGTEEVMSATLIKLIIQLIAGAVGGNAAGAAIKNVDLGAFGNTIAGALGGAGGGTLVTALLRALRVRQAALTLASCSVKSSEAA